MRQSKSKLKYSLESLSAHLVQSPCLPSIKKSRNHKFVPPLQIKSQILKALDNIDLSISQNSLKPIIVNKSPQKLTNYVDQNFKNQSSQQKLHTSNKLLQIQTDLTLKSIDYEDLNLGQKTERFFQKRNHVKNNKILASKINKIKEANIFFDNLTKSAKTQRYREEKEIRDSVQREAQILKMEKWSIFKSRKSEAINHYIEHKKEIRNRRILFKQLICLIQTQKIMKRCLISTKFIAHQRVKEQLRIYSCFKIIFKWKRILRLYGPNSLVDKNKNRVRYSFMMFAIINGQQPKKLIKSYIETIVFNLMQVALRKRIVKIVKLLHGIQRKLIHKHFHYICYPKRELKFLWQSTTEKLYINSVKYKDDGMKQLMEEIKNIDPQIVDFLLEHYMLQCRQRYFIVFNQWRLHYSSSRLKHSNTTERELLEMMEIQIDKSTKKTKDMIDNYKMANATVEWRAYCIIKQPAKFYGIEDQPQKQNEIFDFIQIGWPDPFPQPINQLKRNLFAAEKYTKEQNAEFCLQNKVMNQSKVLDYFLDYPNIFEPNTPPVCIFMPSRKILFKMMRACLGCKKIDDLWICKRIKMKCERIRIKK